jgi:hypothetical protein
MRIANLPLGSQISKTRGTLSLHSSRKTALLLFFLFKEGGPLVFVVGACTVAALSVILSVLLAPIFRTVAGFRKGPAKTQFKAYYWNTFEEFLAEVLHVIWPLCMGMSVTFRVWELGRKFVFASQCNASLVKDGVNKVTGVLNIMFNLVVLIFSDANFTDQGILWTSIILSVLNLLIQILVETEKQKFITSLFKDINENRLNKFELALGLTKCIEDFLEDDVQFNFVQHFVGTGRVRPRVLDEYDKMGEAAFNNKYNKFDKDEEMKFNNHGQNRAMVCGEMQDQGEETIFPFYPLLPKDLKDKFGSDGKYEWAKESKELKVEGIQGMSASAVFAGGAGPPMSQYPSIENGMHPDFGKSRMADGGIYYVRPPTPTHLPVPYGHGASAEA